MYNASDYQAQISDHGLQASAILDLYVEDKMRSANRYGLQSIVRKTFIFQSTYVFHVKDIMCKNKVSLKA
jgi:hypothetical protein